MSAKPAQNFARLAIAVIVGAVVLSAAILGSSAFQRTITTTVTSVSTSVVTITSTTTQTATTTETNTASGADECSHAQAPKNIGLLFGAIFAGTSSPAIVCVQFYYFDSTAPFMINLGDELGISGVRASLSLNEASNFTVSASQSQLTLGGPNNENEGAIIALNVTAKSGTSGTYEVSFPGDMLTAQEPVSCGFYGILVAGNGHPNYVLPSGCLTYAVTGTATTTSIPGIQYPILDNTLYFRVVGVTNSTS